MRKTHPSSIKHKVKEVIVKIIIDKVKEIAGDKKIKINLRGDVDV